MHEKRLSVYHWSWSSYGSTLEIAKAAFIMYTAAEGAEDIFLKGQFFLISQDPPHHTEFFDNPPLDQKKNGNPSPPLPSMTRKVTDMDTLTHSLTYAHECLQACRVGTKDHHSCLF